jgi:hypothetical protein
MGSGAICTSIYFVFWNWNKELSYIFAFNMILGVLVFPHAGKAYYADSIKIYQYE